MEDGARHVEQRTRARLLKRLALFAAIGSLQGGIHDQPTNTRRIQYVVPGGEIHRPRDLLGSGRAQREDR